MLAELHLRAQHSPGRWSVSYSEPAVGASSSRPWSRWSDNRWIAACRRAGNALVTSSTMGLSRKCEVLAPTRWLRIGSQAIGSAHLLLARQVLLAGWVLPYGRVLPTRPKDGAHRAWRAGLYR